MHMLWTVIDVVLALTTLLRGQSLPELALGLVLWHLILAGLNWARTRVFLCAPRGFKGVIPVAYLASAHGLILIVAHLLSQQIAARVRLMAMSLAARSARCPRRP